ncbi:MAG: AAA family ATPase, partial [Candidatus Eremiobacteraeota bacterium]|nr:AAA family ATPase [Candidatus Eremiobacteraeota bacterium]MBV9408051.1 AAA family ATPase [Candidatus Eremiobacteraeota bacterium]
AAASIEKDLDSLEAEHLKADDKVQQYVDQLKDKGLASSIAELNEWSRRKTTLVAQIAHIDAQRPLHDDLIARFDEKLHELADLRTKISELRRAQLASLNHGFNRAGFRHDVFLARGPAASNEMMRFLQDRLAGSYYQYENILTFCRDVEPAALAQLLESRDLDGIAALPAVGAKWAPTFVEKLGDPESILYLRTVWKPQAPRFKIIDRNSKNEIDFKILSDGQKHTVMLTIALMSDSRYPLVIDQPEDDLDNKFIAERVVKTLRDIKERRQVILVTHNANIAVLGDSEQLLAMEHAELGGRIASRGSIDDAVTKQAVQDCLEGGAQALRMRFDVYGLSPR